MKNILLVLLVCLASYGAYSLWHQSQTHPAAPPEIAREEPRPTPAPEPAPKAEEPPPPLALPEPENPIAPIAPVAPVAPVKRLAPEGVYYVIQPVSLTTDAGVVGIKVGTGVRLIQEIGDTLKVTDGKNEFVAKRQQLSNDLDLVTAVCAAKAQAASASREQQIQIAAETEAQKAMGAAAAEQRSREITESARAAAEQRAQRIAEIRAQIAKEEATKKSITNSGPGSGYQRFIDGQNEKIRQLQQELGRLGVAGSALERR